ncbi:MAG: hypothetical protein F4X64_19155 [Chloroflexi bacterium]|nr:hypothetical protein [Chloroflexota bacterium]
MAEHDQQPEGSHGHQHDERPNLRASLGNLRGTGLSWQQVLGQVASNFRIKVTTRQNCCGNLGQPGC